MHQALYRKYRPIKFDDVSGQEHITSILKHEALNNSVSHAYLFAGSRGTGKTTCAKILAKVVNCLNPENGNPCNECANCKAIDSGNATDVIEMDAATNTGVDYIRDLRDNVMYTPAMLKKRVYIIDEAHMLSDSAFNALLKTIEEPPEHVLYIFATTEPHKIPATIISRCQRFEFRRISMAELSKRLMFIANSEGIALESDGAALISKSAQGGMRDAISLMELCAGSHKPINAELVNEILGTSSYDKMCDVARYIANKDYAKLFETVNDIVVSSKDVLVFFSDLTSFYRDMMIQKSCSGAKYLDLIPQEYKLLEDVTSLFDMGTLLYHSRLLDDAYISMMRNPTNKRLCAEITLMKMCDSKLSTSNDALLARISALEDKLRLMSKGVTVSQDTASSQDHNSETEKSDKKSNTFTEIQEDSVNESVENDKIRKLENWSDIIAKVGEYDQAVESFLKNCECYFIPKEQKYNIVTSNKLMATMLSSERNKKYILDSMICCDVEIDSLSQINIILKTAKEAVSDLDEFI
ncbi:MAG: DNA polymerase III subunit gamma/tau [Clostridia bacterium]|nr:DNA polymerase III subunit gamma/tau [Clostridia bacterium]